MKIKAGLSIGVYNADQETIIEVDEEDLENKTPAEQEEFILREYVEPWANEHIDMWFEKLESKDR